MSTTTATRGIRPRPLANTSVMIGRSARHIFRNIDALITSLALPVMILLLFTYVFGGAVDGSGRYIDYVVPGVILLCAGYGASATAVSVSKDMTEGIVDRFRTMHVVDSAVLTGHVVASVLRNLVSTAIVIGVAVLIGYRAQAALGGWFAALGVLVLFIIALSYLSAAIGLIAKTPEAAGAWGFVVLFLPYLSSAFVQTNTLPDFLRPVAEHQPITPIIETLRALLDAGSPGDSLWLALAWLGGILVVSAAGCVWLWRRSRS